MELLVVIVIIGLLAALVTGAVIGARLMARKAVIRTDINQLEQALEQYKTEYGDYPPDFAGLDDTSFQATAQQRVLTHLRKRFPRYNCPDWNTFKTDVATATSFGSAQINVDNMSPASALVFWLGGLPDGADPTTLTGFSANPAQPFQARTTTPSRIAGLMNFRSDQLAQDATTSRIVYHPAGKNSPYLYFKADLAAGYYGGPTPPAAIPLPYKDSTKPNAWVNPKTYQIISAGMDDGYGSTTDMLPPQFPSGANFSESGTSGSHMDNVTNFTTSTIEAEMSK